MDQNRRRELLELAAASIEDDASPLSYEHFIRVHQLTGTEMDELLAGIAAIVRRAAAAPPGPRAFSWDWKEQPPLAAIGEAASQLSVTGQVFLYPVPDTGGDNYALVVSGAELDEDQIAAAYDAWLDT